MMASSGQSLTHAPLGGAREDVLEVERVGLGVTEAALQVFSNFVEQITADVGNTSAVTENPQASTSHLRRSKRIATSEDAPSPSLQQVQQLPTPLEHEVRTAACVSCRNGRIFRVSRVLGGNRSIPAARPWVPPGLQ